MTTTAPFPPAGPDTGAPLRKSAQKEKLAREREARQLHRDLTGPKGGDTYNGTEEEQKRNRKDGEQFQRDQEREEDARGPRRRQAAKRGFTRARRQVSQHAPVIGSTSSQLWHVVVVSLVIVGLYLALVNAKGVGTVMGGLQSAIAWLVSPTATI